MSTQRSMHNETIAQRGTAYGIPGERVDGNNALAVYNCVYRAAERARAGEGPTLFEAYTYRYKGHSKRDQHKYRTRDEIREWQQRDPIQHLQALLIERQVLDENEGKGLETSAYQAIEAAYEFAKSSPEPDPETLLEGVYA